MKTIILDGVKVEIDDGYVIQFENGRVGIAIVKQNLVICEDGGLCVLQSLGMSGFTPKKIWSGITYKGTGIWGAQSPEDLIYDSSKSKTQKEIEQIEKTIQDLQSKVSKLKSSIK